ncbi:MAG: hypothetical protein KGL75_04040, partial [Acidobacteriota bacterium]|nr:hypothetical protein [Acidobacteriota bacterium]
MRHKRPPLQQPQREEGVTREEVLAFLAKLSESASIRRIAHGMGLRHRGRRYLPRILEKLVRAGDVEEFRGGRYRLAGRKHQPMQQQQPRPAGQRAPAPRAAEVPASAQKTPPFRQPGGVPVRDPNVVSGRIVAHRDGYGFVVADAPIPGIDGDLFIGRDGLEDAMHGDR